MRDYRFHCEDCDSYRECAYYHGRKGTSLICKEFQYGSSSVIEQIRAEIEALPRELPTDARNMVRRTRVLDIIDKYAK